MSEFEQSTNQSAEPAETNDTPIEQTQEQPSSPQESNYFTVKYNKEERQVSYDEAPDYIQKGLNYDKVSQKVSEYEQRIQDIAQLMEYQSPDDLFSALEQAKREREEARYRDAGIDPSKFNQLLEEHPDIQYAREMRAKQESQQQFQQEVGELLEEFPDLTPDKIPNEVLQLKEQRGLSLLDAYLRHSYKNIAQQKEQEVIQKLQQNTMSSPGSLSAGAEHKANISSMPKSDFASLVERVKRGENVQI